MGKGIFTGGQIQSLNSKLHQKVHCIHTQMHLTPSLKLITTPNTGEVTMTSFRKRRACLGLIAPPTPHSPRYQSKFSRASDVWQHQTHKSLLRPLMPYLRSPKVINQPMRVVNISSGFGGLALVSHPTAPSPPVSRARFTPLSPELRTVSCPPLT